MKRSLPAARLDLSMTCGLLLSVMVIGCAGSLDPGVTGGGGAGGGGPPADCQVPILAQCAGCHSAGGGAAALDLGSPNPETRLVGKPAAMTADQGACFGMTLLNANTNPATGVFIDKITMNPPPCGMSMPYGAPLLVAADQACLKAWAVIVDSKPAAFTGEETP